MDPPPPPPPPSWQPPAPRSSRRWVVVLAACAAIVVVLVIALLVIGAAVGHQNPLSSTAGFTDPTSHFSATYQDQPAQKNQSTTMNGRAIDEVLWTDTIDAGTTEIVGYADFPADFTIADPHKALEGSVNGEVSNTSGSLVSKTFGTYQGFPSVDAVISAAGGYIETRAVLAGRTLYIVVVTSENNPPELFASFASSLHILHHAA